jgi:hypothetical protein
VFILRLKTLFDAHFHARCGYLSVFSPSIGAKVKQHLTRLPSLRSIRIPARIEVSELSFFE